MGSLYLYWLEAPPKALALILWRKKCNNVKSRLTTARLPTTVVWLVAKKLVTIPFAMFGRSVVLSAWQDAKEVQHPIVVVVRQIRAILVAKFGYAKNVMPYWLRRRLVLGCPNFCKGMHKNLMRALSIWRIEDLTITLLVVSEDYLFPSFRQTGHTIISWQVIHTELKNTVEGMS